MTEKTQPLKMNIGIYLTLMRLLLVPFVIVGIVTGNIWLAAISMSVAWLSDLADGGISRLRKEHTAMGKEMDSVVDFVLIHTAFIALYAAGIMPLYQFIVIIVAMVMTMLLFLLGSATGGGGLPDTLFSRPNGALEYTFLLYLIVTPLFPNFPYLHYIGLIIFAGLAVVATAFIVESLILLKRMFRS